MYIKFTTPMQVVTLLYYYYSHARNDKSNDNRHLILYSCSPARPRAGYIIIY